MAACVCSRCGVVAERRRCSVPKVALYVSAFAIAFPWAWLLFVAGPGVVGVVPAVIWLGFGVDTALRDWAFPRPLCRTCGATLEHAPLVRDRATR